MCYNVISTGSQGNSIIYHNNIMVDCGIPFVHVEPYLYDIQLILLTHIHGDHFNKSTIRRIVEERPTLRVGCCKWLEKELDFVKNLDVYEIGETYNYGSFSVSPVKLYHDVPNCGYRIIKSDFKIFHATDTAHLEGIKAENYDLFAVEHNYDEESIDKMIEEIEARGDYAYQKESRNTHLSDQKAGDFIFQNMKDSSQILRLHESRFK